MELSAAVANRRFHHQLPQGGVVEDEPFNPLPAGLKAEVQARGYTVSTNFFDTDVQAIRITHGVPTPVADPRGRGVAIQVK